MLKSIANKIASNFKDDDTNIISIVDYVTNNDVRSELLSDHTKNLIVLMENVVVTGNLNLTITESPNQTSSSTPTNFGDDNKVVKIAEIVHVLNNMDESKTYSVYLPSPDTIDTQSAFKIISDSNSPGVMNIVPKSLTDISDIFIPGGKSFVYVVEKTQDYRNATLSLTRDTYCNIVCKPNSSTVNSNCDSYYSSNAFWSVTSILVFIALIFLVILLFNVFTSKDSTSTKSNVNDATMKSTLGSTPTPTSAVTLTATSDFVSSPVESIAIKLGKLRKFL